MSKSDAFENDWMRLVYNGTPIPNLADNAASSPLTQLYAALHTADPGEAGTQATSEASYPGYSRVAIPRTTGGFTVTGSQAANAALVAFVQATGGPQTVTHFSIGVAASGAGKILYRGQLGAPLVVNNLVAPQFPIGSMTSSED
jgi:hypothetical protein